MKEYKCDNPIEPYTLMIVLLLLCDMCSVSLVFVRRLIYLKCFFDVFIRILVKQYLLLTCIGNTLRCLSNDYIILL